MAVKNVLTRREATEDLFNAVGNRIRCHINEVKVAIAAGANVNARDEYGATPLTIAASHGCLPNVVKLLIASGADVNLKGKDGLTPLFAVISEMDGSDDYLYSYIVRKLIIKTMAALIDRGANVNLVHQEGNTLLNYIIPGESFAPDGFADLDFVKVMVDGGANI